MPLVSLNEVLRPAYKGKYAIGAFNTFNEDITEAILCAADKHNMPVIVSFSEVQLEYVDLECIAEVTKIKARRLDIPIVLHLDHGLTLDTVKSAIDLGFTSVMFDGSALDYDENVRYCGTIVDMCKPLSVSVEAELGAVGGDEDGALESAADEALYTNINQAVDFIEKTNIDALAIAIGNAHGKYKKKPILDFVRLDELNKALNLPLVLHGGSGISDADIQKAINLGISKINYYTGMLQTAISTTSNLIEKCGAKYSDYLDLLRAVKEKVTLTIMERMTVFQNNRSIVTAKHPRKLIL
ncbi:MAG: ketose-bisphosphate aldolase [Spirochaetales bacterium]|nr:ketose-bisphosphate aldolase [Spirochaetales bacterium]